MSNLSTGASVATMIIAITVVLGILGGIVGMWVDVRISKKLEPLLAAITDIKLEYMPNGGVHPREKDGKPDGTSKDLQADTLQLVRQLTKDVNTLSEKVGKNA